MPADGNKYTLAQKEIVLGKYIFQLDNAKDKATGGNRRAIELDLDVLREALRNLCDYLNGDGSNIENSA